MKWALNLDRGTLDRVNCRSQTKSDNFKSLYFRKYGTEKFQCGSIGFFVKFPFRDTSLNWICDFINIKIWNFSQKIDAGLFYNSPSHCAQEGRFNCRVMNISRDSEVAYRYPPLQFRVISDVSLTKERNSVTLLPKFSSQITFLLGEYWAILTENLTNFSLDLMQTSEKVEMNIAQVHFCEIN